METTYDIALVGGGIAGLVGAIEAASQGARVVLLERAQAVGGRARSFEHEGFVFNQGAHALYDGALAAALKRFGRRVSGKVPDIEPAFTLWGGQMVALPTGAMSLLRAGWLTLGDKVEFGRVMVGLARVDARAHAGQSADEWVAAQAASPRVRGVLRALLRVSTYGGSFEQMSAECALSQVALATRGVRYLDGGWQALVDGLLTHARSLGVVVLTGQEVRAIEGEAPSVTVRTAQGQALTVGSAVVSGAPGAVAALVEPTPGPLHAFAARAVPVRATTLDVALRRPPRGVGLVLGADAPVYLNDHSRTARLGPEGGALVHAMRYDDGAIAEPGAARAALEGLLTQVMPSWRDELVHAQFLPRMVVHHALVTAAQGGFAGRPGPATGRRGVLVAGDWVGPEGLLADASAASAVEAARLALRDAGYARRDAA